MLLKLANAVEIAFYSTLPWDGAKPACGAEWIADTRFLQAKVFRIP